MTTEVSTENQVADATAVEPPPVVVDPAPEVETNSSEPIDIDTKDGVKEANNKNEKAKARVVEEEMEDEPEKETELEKYWRAVKDNPQDFTGWTYLLQYVEQENNLPGARTAFEAFLNKYPYCYGYWKKYADMEKRNENYDKAEEVFQKGVQAISLSIELWIHYLNFVINKPEPEPDHEDRIRALFEKAISAAGMAFKSDKLWDMYLLWEKDGKNFKNMTKLYDRLIATPTQLYSHHFEQFGEHVKDHHPKDILSLDEFLDIRKEVLKDSTPEATNDTADDAPPGAEEEAPPGEDLPPGDDAPPGESGDSISAAPPKSEEKEMAAVREKVLARRKKVYNSTEQEVSRRWAFEEGIRRPYFHVKPLEKGQLKNWREYLDYEIENGSKDRTMVLFERCVIACALYEEFWLKFAQHMEDVKNEEGVRNVYRRACTIHLPQKPNLNLAWAAFEEKTGRIDEASKVLESIEANTPGLAMVHLRSISLARRQGQFQKTQQLYENHITKAKTQEVKSFYTIKYSRYLSKVLNNLEKAKSVLQAALKQDPGNVKLHLQLIDIEYQQTNLNESELCKHFDQSINSTELALEHRVAFSQRRLEYLEDFGSRVDRLLHAYEEHQKLIKELQSQNPKKRKQEGEGETPDGKKAKADTAVTTATGTAPTTNGTVGEQQAITATTDPAHSTATTQSYDYNQWGYGSNAYAQGYQGWGNYGYYGHH